ncbi:MAG: ATP-dependent DNA ligase [Micrococcales bacterium]|nr:ATP-dependent DNA ligase [Micrococcales bacterium]
MGLFLYEDMAATIEDRALAHLQVVMMAKLRRGEGFQFSWRGDGSAGSAPLTTVWVHPGAKVGFEYESAQPPELSRQWIDRLSEAAYSAAGLHLLPEEKPVLAASA